MGRWGAAVFAGACAMCGAACREDDDFCSAGCEDESVRLDELADDDGDVDRG